MSELNTIYLKDYTAPSFLIEKTTLTFEIFPEYTLVRSHILFSQNPLRTDLPTQLDLFGVDLEIVSLSIDSIELSDKHYTWVDEVLCIKNVPTNFLFEAVTKIYPDKNTSLEGLYLSNGMYCTQCEAEGFRKITFYPDRPDVMSEFETRIEADLNDYPTLLSNGNLLDSGELENNRHFAVWQDPFKKPCYLFALVAGDLDVKEDVFTTVEGKKVELKIFVESHNMHKTEFAMQSLIRSMKWDEERFGRVYDLDLFMIVAVDHFNMGAMENKGLNIFNSALVLADEATTTDAGFERIESVIGHEYFHNWSGNRVTCRDWFQLSLKEGFTVFRDSEFTADLHDRAVKRIDDVKLLKTMQFAEDAGPMAHPIRPSSYVEINNFYTLTVYEKGAEVVRMLHTLLGETTFRKGSDLYFDRFDGQAVTTEDFVVCMQEVSGLNLDQFQRWYNQAGTPIVEVFEHFDQASGKYTLKFKQSCPPSINQPEKLAFHIPIKMALMNKADQTHLDLTAIDEFDMDTQVYHLTQDEQMITFENLTSKPVASLLRDFSAPVKLVFDRPKVEFAYLLANDDNSFNQFEAGQSLMQSHLLEQYSILAKGGEYQMDSDLIDAMQSVLAHDELSDAKKAAILTLPNFSYLSDQIDQVDVDVLLNLLKQCKTQIAKALEQQWLDNFNALNDSVEYAFVASQVGKRSFKALCLSYLSYLGQYSGLITSLYESASNMTDRSLALNLIANSNNKNQKQAINAGFYEKWKQDTQMVEQWLSIQSRGESTSIADIKALMQHESFDIKTPNKVRSVIGSFAMGNPLHFHAKDGSGYEFLADQILVLNELNPQIASRLCAALTHFKRYDENRKLKMIDQLHRIDQCKSLSKDVKEIVTRSLQTV
ncbi:aminopeptidase N [Marinicellulosiphila megalodicopiae]|uniref:aminopeptidase N n=1 Tax=Marinicellulosiphila megalodicopiae TaxID=2724896 RepID=UPI003BB1542C